MIPVLGPILSLISLGVKTGADVYVAKQETKRLTALATQRHMERVVQGEIEFASIAKDDRDNSWKDEVVLIVLILPILLLAYSVFTGDPMAKEKLDLFFLYFNNFPEFYKWLVVGVFGSIYGLKPSLDLIKRK